MSTIALQDRRVLQLNKTWTPMHLISLEKALHMVFNDRARIVDPEDYQAMSWSDWSKLEPLGDDGIKGANMIFRVPQVIVLNEFDKLPQPRKTFSRRTLFRRDNFTCQYCGVQPGTENLTVEHVLPRAQGGVTSWENCTTACVECNAKKANRTPEQANMPLRSKPGKPRYNAFNHDELTKIDCFAKFVSEAYWNVPLID